MGSAEGNSNRFVDSRYSSQGTRDYFTDFVENAREEQGENNSSGSGSGGNNQGQEYFENNQNQGSGSGSGSNTSREILNSFANGSLDNILTIATAISDLY
jgi:hypothetical protein